MVPSFSYKAGTYWLGMVGLSSPHLSNPNSLFLNGILAWVNKALAEEIYGLLKKIFEINEFESKYKDKAISGVINV